MFAALTHGETTGYQIVDEAKLRGLADEVGVPAADRDIMDVARDLADVLLEDFGSRKTSLKFTARAPEARRSRWASRHNSQGHRP